MSEEKTDPFKELRALGRRLRGSRSRNPSENTDPPGEPDALESIPGDEDVHEPKASKETAGHAASPNVSEEINESSDEGSNDVDNLFDFFAKKPAPETAKGEAKSAPLSKDGEDAKTARDARMEKRLTRARKSKAGAQAKAEEEEVTESEEEYAKSSYKLLRKRWAELELAMASEDTGKTVRKHFRITPRAAQIIRILTSGFQISPADLISHSLDQFIRKTVRPEEQSFDSLLVYLEQVEHLGEEATAEAIHIGRLAEAVMDLRDAT